MIAVIPSLHLWGSNSDTNKTAIKNIIGHSSYVTTEKIYTHKDVEELRKAIELI